MENESIEEKVIFNYLLNNSKRKTDESAVNLFSNEIMSENDFKMPDNKLTQMEGFWNEMDCGKTNCSYRALDSGRNFTQKVKIFVKKVVRKLLTWYIDPICVQQTNFNGSITRLSGAQIEVLKYYQQQLVEMENKLVASECQKNELQDKSDTKIQTMEQKIEYLEEIIDQVTLACNNNAEQICKIEEKQERQEKGKQERQEKGKHEICTLDRIPEFDNLFFQQVISIAQSGEDRILSTLLFSVGINYSECTYIDIGANHPITLSNTYYFYKLGAQGVLVEANPDLIPALEKIRPLDTVLNRCVSNDKEDIGFYIMNKDGLSTASKQCMESLVKSNSDIYVKKQITLKTITVNEIIEQYLKVAPTILNIDIEGMELDILRQMDFEKYRPFVIIVENIGIKVALIHNQKNKELDKFMESKGYTEYAFTGINSIFIDSRRG